uniref:hypothetical protein n=1 Tax=Aureimonas sp. SK2 TaxID=3015992 RepID=UPI0024449D5B
FDRAAGHLFGWEGAGSAVQAMRQAVIHPAGIFGGGPAVIDVMAARPDPVRLEMTKDDANL